MESSLWAVDSATKNYYSKLVLQDQTTFDERIEFKIQDNVCEIIDGVESLGCLEFEADNIRIGYVSIYSNNSASICIDDGNYFANKSASDTIVILGDGKCTRNYDADTQKYLASSVVTEDDIKSLVDRIKELENRADTLESGQSTMSSDISSLDTRATNIENGTNTEMNKTYFLNMHPVGSIYTTVAGDENSASAMHNKYGGTWENYGAGRVLVSYNASDASFSTINGTGGEKTHTLTATEMPSHTHTITVNTKNLTGSAMNFAAQWYNTGVGSDGIISAYNTGSVGYATSYVTSGLNDAFSINASHNHTASASSTGGSGSHNNLQPYIVVYMYKRVS